MDTALETLNEIVFIYPTRDTEVIDRVCQECREAMSTDQHPESLPASRFVDEPGFLFLEVKLNEETAGVLALRGNEIHTMFLKALRGRKAIHAMKGALQWIWANLLFHQIVSCAYSHRKDACYFARMSGYVETGRENDGTTFHGAPVQRVNFACFKT